MTRKGKEVKEKDLQARVGDVAGEVREEGLEETRDANRRTVGERVRSESESRGHGVNCGRDN